MRVPGDEELDYALLRLDSEVGQSTFGGANDARLGSVNADG